MTTIAEHAIRAKIETILAPAIDCQAPYAKIMIGELVKLAAASPAIGLSDQEQVLVSWVRSHITFESIKGSDILKLLSIINRLSASASPSLTEEEIKKLMVTIPQKEFATASDDYMRGYQSGVNAHRNAVLALIRGERGT